MTPPAPAPAAQTQDQPLSEAELDQLQALLDVIPDTLEPMDVVMIDGYLCGLLLQPKPVPPERWLAHIPDVDARKPPARFDMATVSALVQRRYAELDRAIRARQWFDPWVFPLDAEDEGTPADCVLPWVLGFDTAVNLFTTLFDRHEDELLEPLATLYRHFDPDDLEDADELLAEIETLAPPETIAEAVEDLVRSVLLIADVSRPQQAQAPASRPGPRGAGARTPGRGAPNGHPARRGPGATPGSRPAAKKTGPRGGR
jgi:uncharacterized protein